MSSPGGLQPEADDRVSTAPVANSAEISPLGSSSITAEIRASYKASYYLANLCSARDSFGKKEFPRNPSLRRITGIFVTKKGIPSGTS